ncbi:10073_t:CDS:2, partial [Acaulospora morrowiae]
DLPQKSLLKSSRDPQDNVLWSIVHWKKLVKKLKKVSPRKPVGSIQIRKEITGLIQIVLTFNGIEDTQDLSSIIITS